MMLYDGLNNTVADAAKDFDGEVLNSTPLKKLEKDVATVCIPIILPHHTQINCDEINEDIKSGNIRKELMLYSDMKEQNYLSVEYIQSLDTFLARVLNDPVKSSRKCGIVSEAVDGDDYYQARLVVKVDEGPLSDMCCGKKLLRIMEHTNVFAVPIVTQPCSYIGYDCPKYNNMFVSGARKYSHFALCLGRVNNNYLVI